MIAPIDRVRNQLPERIRHRLELEIRADAYMLRVEVVAEAQGRQHRSGPLEIEWDPVKRIVLPDWFVAHLCTVPLDDEK